MAHLQRKTDYSLASSFCFYWQEQGLTGQLNGKGKNIVSILCGQMARG